MNSARIAAELDLIAAQPGILACALVDGSTGLVWHVSGATSTSEHTWEAAVDYWRLHNRQKVHFAGLGPLGAAVMYHAHGVLAVLPCCDDPDVLLVSHARHSNVDWIALQRMGRALGHQVASSR